MQRKSPKTMLPNGLAAHGATPNTVRLYQLILDYFHYGVAFVPGMTVVDVGANIGLFSLEVLQRCGGDVNLIALEPGPLAYADLERNLREHFPTSPARPLRCALSDHPGEAVFYDRPLASALSSLEPGGLTDRRQLVQSLLRPDPPADFQSITPRWLKRLPRPIASQALDWLIRRVESKVVPAPCRLKTLSQIIAEESITRVDFLKVDVEGAELKVLGGVVPADWPKIEALAVEVHDIDDRVEGVRRMLEDAGFARIEVGQEWLFESSNVYMVFAGRERPDASASRDFHSAASPVAVGSIDRRRHARPSDPETLTAHTSDRRGDGGPVR
ncbi:FkbM family methyltransferase [Paludisphaera borealis]|uniref:31-O-demethyl-FK506 methyltransferase FkbM n=1 Tax=Paludisphaera borealis TaxID=1387353 RepID=A0A1U7CTS5_9BACT|nr:FkbM family methyltransferase [Paludisphaera borealis]APW62347.1 31-O-demethyl-FK506 methyltransferase FkbM [Paludisphaera borealis]